MIVTRPKQGIEAEGGDHLNVSKTIVKEGLVRCLGYCANVPMTIGKTDYEEGGRKGGIAPMCLSLLRSKALRDVWDIAPMCQ